MNKTQLVEAVAQKTGLTKAKAAEAVDAFADTVVEALAKGDQVALLGFGTFKVTERAARTGRNPQTGETINIKASKGVNFKAGSSVKNAVN